MQTKIIKKILAVMIVASTALATPGLVSAGGPNLTCNNKDDKKDKTNASDNKPNSSKKLLTINSESEPKKPEKTNDQDQPQIFFIDPIDQEILKMNGVLSKPFRSNSDKKYFIETIKKFSKYYFFNSWTKKNIDGILQTLNQCLTDQSLKDDISDIVGTLFKVGCFQNWSGSKSVELLKVLNKCSDDEGKKIIISIKDLAYLGRLENLDENDLRQVLNILNQYASINSAKKDVSSAILELFDSKCFKNCSDDLIFDVMCMLYRCSDLMQNESDFAKIIKSFAYAKYFKNYNQNQVLNLLNMLTNRSNSNFAKREVAHVVKYLTNFENFQKWTPGLIDILDRCSANFHGMTETSSDAKGYAVSAILNLTKHNCFKGLPTEDIVKVMNILFRCSYSDCVSKDVGDIIKYLKGNGYLENWLKNNVAIKKVASLMTDLKKNENIHKEPKIDDKINISDETAMKMPEINANINDNVKIDLSNKKKKSNKSTANMLGKKTNRDCNIEIEINISNTKIKDDSENVKQSIENLFNEALLNKSKTGISFEPQIKKIVDMLLKYCDYDDSKEFVARLIGKLIDKNLLHNSSKQIISQIVNMLNQCADDAKAKNIVAFDASMLIDKNLLGDCSSAAVQNIKNILIKCSDEDNAKACVAKAIEFLAEKGMLA